MKNKNDNPLITVIIPVYNNAEFLEKCFDSVIEQTYKNLEIIVVDDGSTDGSGDICDKYQKKDSRFNVLHKKNEGVSKARNDALKIAQGDFIGFVDSDDTIESDMYEFLYSRIIEHNADIAICGTTVINEGLTKTPSNIKSLIVFDKEEAVEKLFLGRAFTASPCDRIFKRECIENICFPEDIYVGEDAIFVLEAILSSQKVVLDPVPKYNYYKRQDSATTGVFSEKMFTYHTASERMLELVSNMQNDKLVECANTALLLCDNRLLHKLCSAKQMKSEYAQILQKSIRTRFKFSRLKQVKIIHRISIIASCVSLSIFSCLSFIRTQLKNFLGEQND